MGPLLLFITTFIWGTAFLAQKVGGESLGPFTITCARSFLGGFFLLGVFGVRQWLCRPAACPIRRSVVAGVVCGVPLFAAIVAQQVGIAYTTPGISAFLTTNYVLFVPLLAAALARKRPSVVILAGAAVALAGTYLICVSGEGVGVGKGELWTLLCALLFSVQMVAVDRLVGRADPLVLSISQLFTCAVLGLVCFAVPSEVRLLAALPSSPALKDAILSLLYVGVLSSGVAYTLQTYGQARTQAGLAAIICSMESVFGALAGFVVRGDTMTSAQFCGCALVFAAAVGTQVIAAALQKGRK